jgi:hypothetical protein
MRQYEAEKAGVSRRALKYIKDRIRSGKRINFMARAFYQIGYQVDGLKMKNPNLQIMTITRIKPIHITSKRQL